MSSQRLVFRNGFVVSMDPDIGEIPNGEVLVEDGVIVDVGPDLGVSDAEEIDATGMIVMPGFVDTHRHTWQTPVRGVLPCCTLDHYFAVMLGSVGGHYRPEDVHIGNYAGSLEAINGGVTTLLDWSHINNTPDHSDAAVQGLKDAGIRAIYAHGVPTGGEWWAFSELEPPRGHPPHPRHVLLVRRRAHHARPRGARARQLELRGRQARLGARARPRDPDQRARRHAPDGVHVTHVKNMDDLGLLGPDTTYIHCTDSTDEELDLIASTGGSASIAPVRRDADGPRAAADGQARRPRRPSVAVSVDVVSSVPGEMFTQMRTALVHERIGSHHRHAGRARSRRRSRTGTCSSSRRSRARAHARSRTRSARSRRSKQADIVLLNVNAINTMPMVDPIGTIVVFSDTSNVDSVFVAGQRRQARRQARRRRPRQDLRQARRVEEPHPRRGRAPARLGGRAGGSGLAACIEPGPRERAAGLFPFSARKEWVNGERQRGRRRRDAGARPRARAVLCRRRS